MPSIGPLELVLVCLVVLLVLGPKRLPEAGRGLGRGFREFKESLQTAVPGPGDDMTPADNPGRMEERPFPHF
jgi:sec-independent protein translocase protein TatA